MKSSELNEFSGWVSWPDPDGRRIGPQQPGVYVFRLAAHCAGRLKGESDILRIGTTESGERTIQARLADHARDAANARNLVARTGLEVDDLQVAWRTCKNHKEAQSIESDLLARYSKDHIELPPGNHQQSWACFQEAKSLMKQLSPQEMRKLLEFIAEATGRNSHRPL